MPWPKMNMCATPFSLLFLWATYMSATRQAEDLVPLEHLSSLQPSKASLVYFRRDTSPSAEMFLEQLEKSTEALRDYGISVLKVNCHSGKASGYCRDDSSEGKAYLFSALLFNEVKYVATVADLQKLEDSLKGHRDLVFAYVQAVGTAEHRALMEAAFVYDSLKFALTTEVMVLRSIRSGEPDVPSSKLFFCHCKVATDLDRPCRRTLMGQPLTTLNIHRFLKLMAEPLVAEATEDPEKVSTTHLHLGLPLIFILAHEETLEADKGTAEFVAWQLLGKAGVLLLSRSSISLDVLPRCNVALKTPEEGAPVKYLVLKDVDEIIALVENGKQREPTQEREEEEEEEEEEEDGENYEQEIQDDEVVESVIRDRKRELPLEHIQTLTEDSFAPALAKTNSTAVLFYASWEAVSLVVMQSYAEVAARLQGTPEIMLAKVNCWDWPDLCAQQNVTQFPTIKMYVEAGRWLAYSGMWGVEEMLRFIDLSRTSCPVKLTTAEEVEDYLRIKTSVSVLGLFDSSMSEAREAFVGAGRVLSGYVTTGIYDEEDVDILSHKYKAPLPALLLARPEARTVIQLSKFSVQDVVEVIRRALLETFPEITVGNLPEYFQLEKPLLLLFSDGALAESQEGEMRRLATEERRKEFVPCWMNLKNTPAGRRILKAYFGSSLPPLPLLLWINLHSGGQVFAFPPDQSVSEANVLAWIEKLKSGQEVPSAVLSGDEWKPRLPAYDFLSMMEPSLPEFTIYSRGSVGSYQKEEEEGPPRGKASLGMAREDPTEDSVVSELEKDQLTGGDLRGTAPRLSAREKQAKRHAEL
ncbi:thioredoxin domain-containing protein 16 isoform X2 [Podarcis muralis]